MCLTKSTRVRQLIVKQTGCLPFVQVAPKCLPFPQDTTKQRYLSRKATMGIFGLTNILNKSNAILAACLHLLATFGLECRAFACKKRYHLQKSGGRGKRPPCPSPSVAYACDVVTCAFLKINNHKILRSIVHESPYVLRSSGW